jgi:hypothetical protein
MILQNTYNYYNEATILLFLKSMPKCTWSDIQQKRILLYLLTNILDQLAISKIFWFFWEKLHGKSFNRGEMLGFLLHIKAT